MRRSIAGVLLPFIKILASPACDLHTWLTIYWSRCLVMLVLVYNTHMVSQSSQLGY